jgi:hypothetical protein
MTEKTANFAGLYYPHFTTFRNETYRNITNFVILFQAVMKFLSRSKFHSKGERSITVLAFLTADFSAIFGGTASPTFESIRTTK